MILGGAPGRADRRRVTLASKNAVLAVAESQGPHLARHNVGETTTSKSSIPMRQTRWRSPTKWRAENTGIGMLCVRP
jgi:hypothetical protein